MQPLSLGGRICNGRRGLWNFRFLENWKSWNSAADLKWKAATFVDKIASLGERNNNFYCVFEWFLFG